MTDEPRIEDEDRAYIHATGSHYPIRAKYREQPEAITIDVVERRHPGLEGQERTGPATLHVPNAIFVNGQPIYTPSGTQVKVESSNDDATKVTLTFFARRVRFGHEDELSDPPA